MDYGNFLFAMLFMNHVENNNTKYQELEYDLIYPEVIRHREMFLNSEFNVNDRDEYSCIIDYLKNNIPLLKKETSSVCPYSTLPGEHVPPQKNEEEGWTCTDPSCNQYGRKIGDKTYEFKQDFKYPHGLIIKKEAKINLKDYDDAEINSHLAPYGWSIEKLKNDNNAADAEWLMAECIFEQTIITGKDVHDYYLAGLIDSITEYCGHDVEVLRNVWNRLNFK